MEEYHPITAILRMPSPHTRLLNETKLLKRDGQSDVTHSAISRLAAARRQRLHLLDIVSGA
jgi:hypothetical protein